MLNTQQDFEVTMAELKDMIELGKQLEKLERSGAFKKIIMKEYMETFPQTLTMVAVSPDERQRNAAQLGLQGVGSLQQFLNSIHRKADSAAATLKEYEEAMSSVSGSTEE